MPKRRGEGGAAKKRGERLQEIRKALDVSQFEMAEMLNAAAAELGAGITFRDYNVSRNEAGSISFEEAATWLSLDPEARGWDWLVFGQPAKMASAGRFKRIVTGDERKRKAR